MAEEEAENRLSRVPLTALYEALKQVKDGRKKDLHPSGGNKVKTGVEEENREIVLR